MNGKLSCNSDIFRFNEGFCRCHRLRCRGKTETSFDLSKCHRFFLWQKLQNHQRFFQEKPSKTRFCHVSVEISTKDKNYFFRRNCLLKELRPVGIDKARVKRR